MGRVKNRDIGDLIPISESVRILDETYPHLRSIKWNESSDEEDELKGKDKDGV